MGGKIVLFALIFSIVLVYRYYVFMFSSTNPLSDVSLAKQRMAERNTTFKKSKQRNVMDIQQTQKVIIYCEQ